jgi:tartrate dehydratase beta subunit/fumarate hydratase class I family protein
MSNGPTLRERMARIETLMENQITLFQDHIAQDRAKNARISRLLGALAVGVFLFALPGCAKLLAAAIM